MSFTDNSDYIFVYGTLRKCFRGEIQTYFQKNTEFIDYALFQGKLYEISGYPGVVPSPFPEDLVIGEVYKIQANLENFFEILDEYEGEEYNRTQVDVILKKNSFLRVWIYLYKNSILEFKFIPNGDYLTFKQHNF